MVIKNQLRYTNAKTTMAFYIGADVAYQRKMIEKLILNSGEIVGKAVIPENSVEASA